MANEPKFYEKNISCRVDLHDWAALNQYIDELSATRNVKLTMADVVRDIIHKEFANHELNDFWSNWAKDTEEANRKEREERRQAKRERVAKRRGLLARLMGL